MARRARHYHFVPKVLLKHFSENRKNLWLSEVGDDGEYLQPDWRNVDSIFKEYDFYTVLDDQGKPSGIVEKKFYSALDELLGKLLAEIDEVFNIGKVPVFEGEQLTSLHHLVLNMTGRTRHLLADGYQGDFEIGQDYARRVVLRLQTLEPDSPKIASIKEMMFDRKALIAEG